MKPKTPKILKKNLTFIGRMMYKSIGWKKTKAYIVAETKARDLWCSKLLNFSFNTNYTDYDQNTKE